MRATHKGVQAEGCASCTALSAVHEVLLPERSEAASARLALDVLSDILSDGEL